MAVRRLFLALAARTVEQRLNTDHSDCQGRTLPCECGSPARYAGRRDKTFVTALGEMTLKRAYYHCEHCKHGFYPRDRSLGLSDLSLPLLVFATNQEGYAITLAQLWEQCRVMNIALSQQHPVAPSAMCKARAKLDENIFKTLQAQILRCTTQHDADAKWKGHRIYAVDGSKINLPRALIKAGYRRPSDNAYYPQALVSCLYQLKTQIPTDFDMVAHGDERRLARSHLNALNAQGVVVYDRGYYSFEMLHEHAVRDLHPVFRVKRKASAAFDQFIASDQTDTWVEMRPNTQQCQHIRSRDANAQCAPITVRLVKYVVAGTPYTLATTLLDRQQYTILELSDLYHARWGIEELYKVSKNLLSIEDFHAHTERGVKQELFAHFVMITLTRLFSNHSDMQSNPDGCDDKHSYQANFKNALTVVGNKIETLLLKQANMVSETLNQIIAASVRVDRKSARIVPTRDAPGNRSENGNPLNQQSQLQTE